MKILVDNFLYDNSEKIQKEYDKTWENLAEEYVNDNYETSILDSKYEDGAYEEAFEWAKQRIESEVFPILDDVYEDLNGIYSDMNFDYCGKSHELDKDEFERFIKNNIINVG